MKNTTIRTSQWVIRATIDALEVHKGEVWATDAGHALNLACLHFRDHIKKGVSVRVWVALK